MTITNIEQLIAAKNKIRELIKELSHASEAVSDNEGSVHPNDFTYFQNAKLYEKQMMEELREIHIALFQYRGFPVAPEKN